MKLRMARYRLFGTLLPIVYITLTAYQFNHKTIYAGILHVVGMESMTMS